ncbi:hypothetical protein ACSVDE_17375 [Pseudalkalibacillus sp. Hm43]|uniref:hypothetical protein n=1 Tax=Pseudalkalibacillus sp. Hm43 TaxID=3450742 RepID=UPI003F423013
MSDVDILIPGYIITFLLIFALTLFYVIKKPYVSVLLILTLFVVEEGIVTAVFFKLAFPIGSGIFAIAWTYIGLIGIVVGVIILLITLLVKRKNP